MKKRSTITQIMNPEMVTILHRISMYVNSRLKGFPVPSEADKLIFTEYIKKADKLRTCLKNEITEDGKDNDL